MTDKIEGFVDLATFSPMVKGKLFSSKSEEVESQAIVDTGYNGEIILPESQIEKMGLEFLGTIDSELANGEVVEVELFRGRIKWFDKIRNITIGCSQSKDILLGTLLLTQCEVNVDFKQGRVRIEQLL